MSFGNFNWLWAGTALLVLSAQPAEASWRRCGHVVVQTFAAWSAGIGTKVAPIAVKEDAPIELEDLTPDFVFVRGRWGGGLYLHERHSDIRLSFADGELWAQVPVGEGRLSERIILDEPQQALLASLFSSLDLTSLDSEGQAALAKIFYDRVCKELFLISHRYLERIGKTDGDPNFQLNGSSVWHLQGIDEKWEGFQVEGYLDKDGKLATTRFTAGRWAVLRVIVGKGLIEIRALPTNSTEPGYRFIRVPLARLLSTNGHFSQNLEKFAVSHYDDALKNGQLVNGEHFPYNHIHITRALEIGLDPERGYSTLSYVGKPLVIVTGGFVGKRAVALNEADASTATNGGFRREITLDIEAQPIPVKLSSSYVMPVSDEPMKVGLDPVKRVPMVLEVNEEVFVRGAGERVRVVSEVEDKGRGLVRHYVVEYLTGPLNGQRVEMTTCALIPQRYLLTRSPVAPKPPATSPSGQGTPMSAPTP